MLSMILFLKAFFLILRLFAAYVFALYLFVSAAKEPAAKVKRCLLIAGWAAVATDVFWDAARWIRPLTYNLTESFERAGMTLVGLSLGLYIAAMIQRESL